MVKVIKRQKDVLHAVHINWTSFFSFPPLWPLVVGRGAPPLREHLLSCDGAATFISLRWKWPWPYLVAYNLSDWSLCLEQTLDGFEREILALAVDPPLAHSCNDGVVIYWGISLVRHINFKKGFDWLPKKIAWLQIWKTVYLLPSDLLPTDTQEFTEGHGIHGIANVGSNQTIRERCSGDHCFPAFPDSALALALWWEIL